MHSILRASTLRSVLLLPFLNILAIAESVTLSEFQQINGFSAQCTRAYNTPIPNCTPNDFVNDNACSQACISGLEALTSLINTECAGTSTSPNTLIGLFFEGKGVQALCPQGASTSPTIQPQTSSPPSASPSQQSVPQTTRSTPSASVHSSSSIQAPSNTRTSQKPSTPQATANPTPATSSPSASSSPPLPSFTLSSPETLTATAHPSSTSNTNSFGGSVDPFGGSASAASTYEVNRKLLAIVVVIVVLLRVWL